MNIFIILAHYIILKTKIKMGNSGCYRRQHTNSSCNSEEICLTEEEPSTNLPPKSSSFTFYYISTGMIHPTL